MGFFKDFKDNLNEFASDYENKDGSDDDLDNIMINTLDSEDNKEAFRESQLAKLAANLAKEADLPFEDEPLNDSNLLDADYKEEDKADAEENISEHTFNIESDTMIDEANPFNNEASNKASVIAKGMTVRGNVDVQGSLEVHGTIDGDVICGGKLTISGEIKGNLKAGEVYTSGAHIDGSIDCEGTAKLGQGTIVIGNLCADSAVVAGAIKGYIDVHGPAIIDSTAVIMGDIMSKTLQINNGAVIDGCCSQCYADVRPEDIFEKMNTERLNL